jgi:carboxypeptidase family protein/TonB-dependent receptor-like protein
MNYFRFLKVFALLVFVSFSVNRAFAQSVVSGEVDGTVTDPAGAVVPDASVNLNSTETGFNASTTTGANGEFRFALLKPGNYTVTVTAAGFRMSKLAVVASLGQATTISIKLEVGVQSESIEVTAESPLLHTENANTATTIDTKTIANIPSPGQDITNFVLQAPGVTVSTGAGYGNLTANGLPGTSNLYTVNGNDYNDPYLNLNNSGASNLLLGVNELQEIAVVTNGYTGEYGRAAGANVNYTTKSGSNEFHGNLGWYYNDGAFNANDWFNNAGGTPRPHAVANQWVGSVGGPIKKNKLFFFYDNEGIRYVLPGGGAPVYLPTAAFASAVQANIDANQPSESAFYKNIFALYAGAPGANRAVALTTGSLGCGSALAAAGIAAPGGGTFGVNAPCSQTFRSDVNNLNTERLQAITIDLNLTPNDTLRWRYKQDRGVQATGTDPINSIFNANSVQPEDDGQMIWTHVFNGHTTNQFIASGLYYSALFGPPNISASLAAFPSTIIFSGGGQHISNMGGTDYNYPQGRNVAQYQFVDDLAWTKGSHGIKFGVNFRRNNIASFATGPLTSGEIIIRDMTNFYNGAYGPSSPSTLVQRFASANDLPIRYYSLGLYLQDEWKVTSRLKLTLALRADRNSDAFCRIGCFNQLASPFDQLDHTLSIPYNMAVQTGLHQAFPNLEKVVLAPRGGFSYSANSKGDLVISGGMGVFSDLYPGLLVDRFITNLPGVASFTISNPSGSGTSMPIQPGLAGGIFQAASASNTALRSGFGNGATFASLKASLAALTPPVTFSAPNFSSVDSNVSNPKYVEWNLRIEKGIGSKTAVSLNYVGNHGYDEFIINQNMNAYCFAPCPFGSVTATAAPDSRFSVVNEISNRGWSNYNGVTASVVRRFASGFQGSLNYTYSHSLDTISNGGRLAYSFSGSGDSFLTQIDPNNLRRLNYGNSDYDFRQVISANYIYQMPFKSSNRGLDYLIGGWSLSGTVFYRSGEPFSVFYSSGPAKFLRNATAGVVLADYISGPMTCAAAPNCLDPSASGFVPAGSQTNFGNLPRNQFRGPGYFNSDFSLQKDIKVAERFVFTLGANAFNVFNHPNFANPDADISNFGSTFGQSQSTVVPPNSPYGNFQGAAVSGRVLQLNAKFRF